MARLLLPFKLWLLFPTQRPTAWWVLPQLIFPAGCLWTADCVKPPKRWGGVCGRGGGGDNQDSRPTWLVPGRGSGHAVWTGPLLARSWPLNTGNSDSLAEGRPTPFCCCFLGLLSVRFLWYCSLFPRLSLQLQIRVVIDECLFIPVMFCPLGSKYVHLRQEIVFVF